MTAASWRQRHPAHTVAAVDTGSEGRERVPFSRNDRPAPDAAPRAEHPLGVDPRGTASRPPTHESGFSPRGPKRSAAAVTVPAAPRGLRAAGRRLWRAVVVDFELAEHELALLREAVRVADVCQELPKTIDAEGVFREQRVHPAVVELRAQRILLARLIVALRVPLSVEDDQPGERTQRRGLRGVYGIRDSA